MTGALAMGANKITGLADPTANQDAATKVYVDNADALKLNLSGGTMTGNVVMGANKVTSTATPTTDDDLTRKGYVDNILGSATSAAASAAAAAVSETNAAGSASSALTSANNAAASYDNFDDRYLGAKASDPTVDNDGDALLVGALYWNTAANSLRIWTGSAWNTAAFDVGTALFASDIGITVQAWDAELDAWATKTAPSGTVVGTSDTQTLTNKTLEKVTLNDGYTEEVFAITDGATVDLDPNNGSIQTWTLGASRTPGQANWAAGQSITLLVDDGSAYAITWSTLAVVWKTDGGVAPTLNTTDFTVIILWKVGATIYGARVGDT
jgi:hypothetical protein